MNCRQKDDVGGTCPEPAMFRYTWPGQDESFICLGHAKHLRNVADAMGLYIQLIPLTAADTPLAEREKKP